VVGSYKEGSKFSVSLKGGERLHQLSQCQIFEKGSDYGICVCVCVCVCRGGWIAR